MQGIQKILVGVDVRNLLQRENQDLNPANEAAVNRALWVAQQTRAELTLFAALRIELPRSEDVLEETAEVLVMERARSALETLRKRAEERGVTAHVKLVSGRGWLEIIREVIRSGQQLVIVGTRDAGAAERLLFGSTAMRLLRKCPCPVWVTRPTKAADPEQATIMVADELSEIGMRALHLAVTIAQATGSRLLVLHAVEFPLAAGLHRSGMPEEEVEAYREKCRSEAENELQERLATTDYRTVPGGTQVKIVAGQADGVIVDAIEEHDVDLLVMGTIARGGIPGFLLGNTAERLFSQITCSVLAIKPDDFVSPVTLEPES
jgi:universal stress protein E